MAKLGPTADAAAVTLSSACIAHCLLTPLLASALPLFGPLAENEAIHLGLVVLAVPFSLAALWNSSNMGARGRAALWGLRGLALAGIAVLAAGALGWPDHDWETPLTLAGSALLITGHGLNFMHRHAARTLSG